MKHGWDPSLNGDPVREEASMTGDTTRADTSQGDNSAGWHSEENDVESSWDHSGMREAKHGQDRS